MPADTLIDANPFNVNILVGFAATRQSPKGYAKFLKHYRSVKRAPFRMDAVNLAASLRILALAHFEDFPNPLTEKTEIPMWERSEDEEYFASLIREESENLLTAAREHLGTHTGKVPNTNVSGPRSLFPDRVIMSAAAANAYVSSASYTARQRIGACGNAAQNRAQRFLASRLLVDDEVLDISEDIAEKGPVYNAMVALGFETNVMEELSAILAGRLGAMENSPPGRNAKGLIWPTDNGDIVITPVHAYAMHVELEARIRERTEDPTARIPQAHVVVGGSSPQNGGLINSDMNGWHRLLISRPPSISSHEARQLQRFLRSGEMPLRPLPANSRVVRDFAQASLAVWETNDVARTDFKERVSELVNFAIAPLVEIAQSASPELANETLSKVPTSLRQLIVQGYRRVDDQKGLVRHISDRIIDNLPSKIEFSEGLRRLFRNAVENTLESHFHGA